MSFRIVSALMKPEDQIAGVSRQACLLVARPVGVPAADEVIQNCSKIIVLDICTDSSLLGRA